LLIPLTPQDPDPTSQTSGLAINQYDNFSQKIIIFPIVEIFPCGLIDLSDSDLGKLDPLPPLSCSQIVASFFTKILPFLHFIGKVGIFITGKT
jgi:hypothetical protein